MTKHEIDRTLRKLDQGRRAEHRLVAEGMQLRIRRVVLRAPVRARWINEGA